MTTQVAATTNVQERFREVGRNIRSLHEQSMKDCLTHGYVDLAELHQSAIAFIDEALQRFGNPAPADVQPVETNA